MSHTASLEFTIVYTTVEAGWTQAQLAELPAVLTAGPSREHARALVVDALREYLAALVSRAPADVRGDRLKLSIAPLDL